MKQSSSGGALPPRNSQYQKKVASDLSKDAKKTEEAYSGGHLVQFSQGGPDELQIPMLSKINEGGEWYKLERMEAGRISRGEDVFVDIQVHYDKKDFPASFTKTTKFSDKTVTLTCDNLTGETFKKEMANAI